MPTLIVSHELVAEMSRTYSAPLASDNVPNAVTAEMLAEYEMLETFQNYDPSNASDYREAEGLMEEIGSLYEEMMEEDQYGAAYFGVYQDMLTALRRLAGLFN